MSGTMNGVQQYIQEMSKNSCPYVHCYAHILNLVLVDVSKQTELIEAVEAYNPSSKMFLDFDTLIKLPVISTDNQFIEMLRALCDLGKKNVCCRFKFYRNLFIN